MLSRSGRPLAQVLLGPVVSLCVKAGVKADTVTVVGTLLTMVVALSLPLLNHLIIAAWVLAALVIFDSLDGQIARRTQSASAWGAFLDSSLDRLADASIFVGIMGWAYLWATPALRLVLLLLSLAALVLGLTVSYVRTRAEGLGFQANVGLAERADRLVILLLAMWFVGMNWGEWIFIVALAYLVLASLVTIGQRMVCVYQQANLRAAKDAPAS